MNAVAITGSELGFLPKKSKAFRSRPQSQTKTKWDDKIADYFTALSDPQLRSNGSPEEIGLEIEVKSTHLGLKTHKGDRGDDATSKISWGGQKHGEGAHNQAQAMLLRKMSLLAVTVSNNNMKRNKSRAQIGVSLSSMLNGSTVANAGHPVGATDNQKYQLDVATQMAVDLVTTPNWKGREKAGTLVSKAMYGTTTVHPNDGKGAYKAKYQNTVKPFADLGLAFAVAGGDIFYVDTSEGYGKVTKQLVNSPHYRQALQRDLAFAKAAFVANRKIPLELPKLGSKWRDDSVYSRDLNSRTKASYVQKAYVLGNPNHALDSVIDKTLKLKGITMNVMNAMHDAKATHIRGRSASKATPKKKARASAKKKAKKKIAGGWTRGTQGGFYKIVNGKKLYKKK
jgi:hypothetical protein